MTFISKVASCLAIAFVQNCAPYVATGLINVVQILIFLLLALIASLVEVQVHNIVFVH